MIPRTRCRTFWTSPWPWDTSSRRPSPVLCPAGSGLHPQRKNFSAPLASRYVDCYLTCAYKRIPTNMSNHFESPKVRDFFLCITMFKLYILNIFLYVYYLLLFICNFHREKFSLIYLYVLLCFDVWFFTATINSSCVIFLFRLLSIFIVPLNMMNFPTLNTTRIPIRWIPLSPLMYWGMSNWKSVIEHWGHL